MATDGPAPDFTISRRGYDRDEVDRHLATNATTIGRLRDRVSSLEERLRAAEDAAAAARAEAAEAAEAAANAASAASTTASADAIPGPDAPASERFAALGEETTRILVAAEDSARDMRERAKRQAEAEVAAAERAARERVDSATEHATRLVGDAEKRRDQIVSETDSYRERVVTEADQRRDQIVAETDAWRLQTVNETESQRDQILADAESRRQQVVAETEARRDAVIAEMEARRDAITAELDERVHVREREIQRLGKVRTNLLAALRGAVDVTNDAVRTLTDGGGDGLPELDDDEDPHPAGHELGGTSTATAPSWETAEDEDSSTSSWSATTEAADPVAGTAWSTVGEADEHDDDEEAEDAGDPADDAAWSRAYVLDEHDQSTATDGDAPTVFGDEDVAQELDEAVAPAGDVAALSATDALDDLAGLDELGDLDGLEEHESDSVLSLDDGEHQLDAEVAEVADLDVGTVGPDDVEPEAASSDRSHGERHGAAPAALRSALADATSAADLGSLTTGDDASPGLRRERSLASVRPGTLRRLRRGLQDVQNGVLEGVREREDGAPEDVLPGNDAADVLADLARPYLDAAYRAGITDAAVLAGDDAPDAAAADDLTVQLASERLGAELLDELTTTLLPSLRAGIEAGEADASLSERVGEVFRDLKGPIVETVADRHLTGTYGRGTIDEWKDRGVERVVWVLGEESRCPEGRCRSNAAEGAVAPGEQFPSGDALPQVHDGCTCALAPATDD